MDITLYTIGIAVLSGLLTTFLIEVVIRQYWRRVLVPWHEDRLYKEVEIQGIWDARAVLDGQEVERVWEICRHGHNVTATVTATKGADTGQTYTITGEFKNLILTASYVSTDSTRTDRGAYTFKLRSNGRVLEGVIAAYSPASDLIISAPYVLWRRVPSDAKAPNTAPAAGG